jgi:hypothetical protein
LVGEADLPQLGMALLGSMEIGHPQRRPMPGQHLATTSAPRLRRTTWITTSAFWNTQFQWPLPSMRTPVSSEYTTRARRSRARMAATSASNRGLPRRNAASSAPSLIARPNNSISSRASRW